MDTQQALEIQTNFLHVQDKVVRAAQLAQRDPEDIRLVVVTKMHSVETIRCVIQAGAKILGENYAEEAIAKMTSLSDCMGLEWHMIGHVQSRKVKMVCDKFALIHSLDSLKLAERLNETAVKRGIIQPVLLEFNLGDEESKSGWIGGDTHSWERLLPDLERVTVLDHLKIQGLMTMPPLCNNPELTRPYFILLKKLQDFLVVHFPSVNWQELSMGTSADFEIAILEGATMVRVGQAILGPRKPKNVLNP
jgi:pyridoxal phosphate enzyme (YggS family)